MQYSCFFLVVGSTWNSTLPRLMLSCVMAAIARKTRPCCLRSLTSRAKIVGVKNLLREEDKEKSSVLSICFPLLLWHWVDWTRNLRYCLTFHVDVCMTETAEVDVNLNLVHSKGRKHNRCE
jgi:hypothetical protein